MLKFLSICAVAGIASAALAAAASGQQPPQGPPPQSQPPAAPPQYSATLNVGDMAPDFSLPGSDGKVHKLSGYRGKHVVIAWFPKAFTGG
jgi:AhpC/TSA family